MGIRNVIKNMFEGTKSKRYIETDDGIVIGILMERITKCTKLSFKSMFLQFPWGSKRGLKILNFLKFEKKKLNRSRNITIEIDIPYNDGYMKVYFDNISGIEKTSFIERFTKFLENELEYEHLIYKRSPRMQPWHGSRLIDGLTEDAMKLLKKEKVR